MQKIIKIFVDADACPVKQEILQVADLFDTPVLFVACYAHLSHNQRGQWVYIEQGQDSVDFYIFQHAQAGDVVVTQDMGLASLLLKKEVHVLSPRGEMLKDYQMESILFTRYVSAKERRVGHFSKGPKALSKTDRHHFFEMLQKLLSNLTGKT
jgi:uncharacterized protein